ncbi:MAG: Dyp-type peroxidase [Proteobacteria bacterium]|nr:Dyp-type peroxidase [Pseudomonadota bacterium]
MTGSDWDRVPIDSQSIDAPLSRAAVFLTLTVADGSEALRAVCDVLDGLDDLIKSVGFRDLNGRLSCIAALGSALWDRFEIGQRPQELRPFAVIEGATHTAPATAGDLFFHIRSEREDLCFEFERLLLDQLGSSVEMTDEVTGFRYFDSRDLLGFVDGTANPTGRDIGASTLVGDEDQAFAGGSYVVVQKYLHRMQPWFRLPKDEQEQIIGREIVSNVELPDATDGQKSHKTLATIVDEHGAEHDILRDNMPFGRPGHGEYGTYFIGYSRYLWVIQKMLERMFIGDPPGMHDRLLDFSTAETGAVFFAPSPRTLSALVQAVQNRDR